MSEGSIRSRPCSVRPSAGGYVLALALTVGCEPAVQTVDLDGDVRSDSEEGDADGDGIVDAFVDAQLDARTDGSNDSGRIDGPLTDSEVFDSATDDSEVVDAPPASVCLDSEGQEQAACFCLLSCESDACDVNHTCVATPCGQRCIPKGNPCVDAVDCHPSSACDVGLLRCVANGAECNDSRDCAAGFACELGQCVNRRLSCDVGCPWGTVCNDDGSGPICSRLYRRCLSAFSCPNTMACVDINGDGLGECSAPVGSCSGNNVCADGLVCAVRPVEFTRSCEQFGVCDVDADCGNGRLCRDLWGDGVKECISGLGTCASGVQCAEGAVCAVAVGETTPRCIGGAQ